VLTTATAGSRRCDKLTGDLREGLVMADVELVLVHGGWGSPEMWRYVVEALGVVPYDIRLADLPSMNRADASFADDVAHVRSLSSAPVVVLCGHSYGCTVITAAGADLPNVAHLVYVAGLALDEGESSVEWYAKRPGAVELSLTVFDDGRDLPKGWGDDIGRYEPEALARIRSLELRPQAAFPSVVMSSPAWHRVPSTFVVASADSLIHPDSQRETAQRANARIVEINTDHMVNLAAPAELAAALNTVMADVSATSG
jgi:pimeloyl-ACP methyl ester carboxylesterase